MSKNCPSIPIAIAYHSSIYKGAGSRIRTDDLLITNQLLYQLSYAGVYLGEPPRMAIPKIEQVYSTISTVLPKQISAASAVD